MSSVNAMDSTSAAAGRLLSFDLFLILFCTFFEFARPTVWSFNTPIIASGILLVKWIISPEKVSSPQGTCCLIWLALMAVHIPFAENNYFAFWTTFLLTTTFAFCLPMMQFIGTVRRFEVLVLSLVGATLYVGVYAIGHEGWGPLGGEAGQDQNYVALAMTVALPFSYFYIFLTKGMLKKCLFAGITITYVLAIVVGSSRGGFVGLVAVAVYCWIRSPGKLAGALVVALVGIVVWAWAPDTYWDEMQTITDSEDGTADHRIELWKIATREFMDYPIAGVGPANFRWEAGNYQSDEQWDKFDRSLAGSHFTHSLYFELLSEMGTLGVLLFGAICFYNYRDIQALALRRYPSQGDPDDIERASYLAKGIGGALLGFLVASVFLSTLYGAYFWFLTGMAVALRHAVSGHSRDRPLTQDPRT